MRSKIILAVLAIPIVLFIVFKLLSAYNLGKIQPSESEIDTIIQYFGNIEIKNEADIIRIQNKSFDLIEYDGEGLDHHQEIVIDSLFKWKKALCFHRSLLLQKIFLYNNIKVTPVFLYHDKKHPEKTSITDLFDGDLQSHNVFLIDYNDKSYLIQTNSRMTALNSLEKYLKYVTTMPQGTKYLKHLNNRNGIYIYPSWLPDIY